MRPGQTSTVDPGLQSERKSELSSHLQSAGKYSESPHLCRTCGTTAADKILYLRGHRKENHRKRCLFQPTDTVLKHHDVDYSLSNAVLPDGCNGENIVAVWPARSAAEEDR